MINGFDPPSTATDAEPALYSLPALNKPDVHYQASKDDAPFPRYALVLEDLPVDDRQVDDGKRNDESRDDGPEQELVPPEHAEHCEAARLSFGIETEEAAREMLHLPCRDEEQVCQRRPRRGPGSEGHVAGVVVAAVAVEAELAAACAVRDGGESHQA